MAVEARQGSSRVQPAITGPVPRARRPEGFAHERPLGWIPAEIAFLGAQGVPPGLLLKAAAKAREVDVTADRALLGAGFPEDTFYRMLARHLGMPYLEQPMRLVLPPTDGPWDGEPEAALLALNARALDRVLAPRGVALRALLETYQPGQGRGSRSAIVSPRCLKALIRRQKAPALLHLASHGLASWDRDLSAKGGPTMGQEAAALGVVLAFAAGLVLSPIIALSVVTALVSSLFSLAVMIRLAATAMSPKPQAPPEGRIPDHHLPVYTIIVPLLREALVVPQLIAALGRLDYPAAKLDIKLMVEEGDAATIAAIEALSLPARFDTIMAPRGFPRTKPRALNIGLAYARGDLLVVYDAEDRPDPDQLRAAVATFRTRRMRTACLQARLAIDHSDDGWLTRMFAMDYAGLFDVVMPGLAAMKLPIALGGTSNHFRGIR